LGVDEEEFVDNGLLLFARRGSSHRFLNVNNGLRRQALVDCRIIILHVVKPAGRPEQRVRLSASCLSIREHHAAAMGVEERSYQRRGD